MVYLRLKFNVGTSTASDFMILSLVIYERRAGLVNYLSGRHIKQAKQRRNKVIHSSAAHKNVTAHILSDGER